MSSKDGGPAFPTEGVVCSDGILYEGMTLRDYFAAKAMQGLLAGTLTPTILWSQQEMAGLSYQMADAMLKAREE